MTLPQPSDAFAWVQGAAGPALVCRPLREVAEHLFTTRHWLLGSPGLDGSDERRWHEVASALAIDAGRLVRVTQVHGANVLVARQAPGSQEDADIIVTDNPDLALAVRAADCVPLLIADSRTGAVAAAHAGWQGLAARVPEAAVAALARSFGSRPGDLVAAAGPSIGGCCYEIGVEVRERFAGAGFGGDALARWFSSHPTPTPRNPSMPGLKASRPGHWFFDGWAATRDQLAAAGLPPGRIFVAETCTASHPAAFCSYRRDGSPAGRLAGAIRGRLRRP